eukprot:Tbor_TRINITY_DN5536_c2_g10::TRINITY_DN5536_c2_g10_i1::g.12789::m.12789
MGYLVYITILFVTISVSNSPYVVADNSDYNPSNYDSSNHEDNIQDVLYAYDDHDRDTEYNSKVTALATGNREEAIMILEQEIDSLRKGRMAKAMHRFQTAVHARNSYKNNLPWFPNTAENKRLGNLEEEVLRQEKALSIVLDEERALTTRLKPLHGVVSWYFAADQQRSIKSSIQTVSEMGYNNAWYSALFSIGEVESIQDLIMVFVGQYLMVFLIFYPFAILYFALWTTPWNIYEYSSSWLDFPSAIIAWISSVAVMVLPFAGFVFGGYVIVRVIAAKEKERLRKTAERRGVRDQPQYGMHGESYNRQ